MQLNTGGLRLNTLFLYFLFHHLYLFFLFFFLNFPYFCNLYLFFFYFLLQPMLILTGFSWCHKFQLHFMSFTPQRERSSTLSVLKWSDAHLKRRWQEFVGAISHNTSFTHCHVLNLILGVSPPIFGLQHCCRFRKRMQLNMGGLRLKTLFLYFLFHHLYLFSLLFFFNFPSFRSLYFFFFYFLLQPMLILAGLSWGHKFQLRFMSLTPPMERSSTLSVLKWSHAHLKRRWEEFVGAISHNTSFTHCPVLNLILAWFGWKLGVNKSFSPNLWLTTLLSLS